MKQLIESSSVLEIKVGDSGWRAPDTRVFRKETCLHEATLLASSNPARALELAQDVYIKANGQMLGIDFRVRTVQITLWIIGSFEDAAKNI
jgi:hypothetical protein